MLLLKWVENGWCIEFRQGVFFDFIRKNRKIFYDIIILMKKGVYMSKLDSQIILNKLKDINPSIEKDGIKLLGLFGSYSRNEETPSSDIDILIETTPLFLEKYKGLRAFTKLEELKTNLEKIFQKNVDIVDKQGLIQKNNTYILNKAIYV